VNVMIGRTVLDPRWIRSQEPSASTPDVTAERGLPQSARPCPHEPRCPGAESLSRDAAHIRIAHPEQGWSLLCNGVIVFDDTGELLPDGRAIAPRRACGSAVR
jgi:hypothetical protein